MPDASPSGPRGRCARSEAPRLRTRPAEKRATAAKATAKANAKGDANKAKLDTAAACSLGVLSARDSLDASAATLDVRTACASTELRPQNAIVPLGGGQAAFLREMEERSRSAQELSEAPPAAVMEIWKPRGSVTEDAGKIPRRKKGQGTPLTNTVGAHVRAWHKFPMAKGRNALDAQQFL